MPDEAHYEIRIQENLDAKWEAYFTPMIMHCKEDETILTGAVHDQAELFGILLKIRDLGLRLVAVNQVE